LREFLEWWGERAGIVAAIVAAAALWYKVRYDLRLERRLGHESREALERKVAELARRFEDHLREVEPLKKRADEDSRTLAVASQKVEGLERQVERVVVKLDELIQVILEWKRNGK
jgi:phage shock protein A